MRSINPLTAGCWLLGTERLREAEAEYPFREKETSWEGRARGEQAIFEDRSFSPYVAWPFAAVGTHLSECDESASIFRLCLRPIILSH